MNPTEVKVRVHDGIEIAVAIYAPEGTVRVPALLGASPYRYDNNILPASPQFLWRETGPIEFYVAQGYAYVHMDIRGCGKSDGEFSFLSRADAQDFYDIVEWIGKQSWCNGKVGTIGQSYYCMTGWIGATLAPPSLACLGATDGMNDPYRACCYNGGIHGEFFGGYWWAQNRLINRFPANGAPGREQKTDLLLEVAAHPTYDDYWRERCAWERLDRISIPVYSVGIWEKHQLHTRGNIDGFRRTRGPRKLRMIGAANAWAAAAEYASVEFHEKVMLPFYDWALKGKETDYTRRPDVEYFVRGANLWRGAAAWPPEGVRYQTFYLNGARTESVTSLNDGGLSAAPPSGAASTSYTYPNPGWVSGVVGFGPTGPAGGFDPARRVLTFTTAPLDQDLEIAGPIKLVLHAASAARDTDFFVKLSEQFPQSSEDRGKGFNPAAMVVSRGWLRASHRAVDPARGSDMEPWHTHSDPQPLTPGQIYPFDISIEPQAYRFKKGNRIRLEIANGDSPVTEVLWTHMYTPNKIGSDTIHHSREHASALILPVMPG